MAETEKPTMSRYLISKIFILWKVLKMDFLESLKSSVLKR